MMSFVAWWHRMMWAHPTPFVVLYAVVIGMWGGRSIGHTIVDLVKLSEWVGSRPLKRWIYRRRERQWLARQPKKQETPYR